MESRVWSAVLTHISGRGLSFHVSIQARMLLLICPERGWHGGVVSSVAVKSLICSSPITPGRPFDQADEAIDDEPITPHPLTTQLLYVLDIGSIIRQYNGHVE